MYEIDDEDQEFHSVSQGGVVKMINHGVVKELDIHGQKVSIIEPGVVQDLQRTVQSLQNYVLRLENSLRSMNLKFSNLERKIRSLEIELDNKVNYD